MPAKLSESELLSEFKNKENLHVVTPPSENSIIL
jgi:hypothetical protein